MITDPTTILTLLCKWKLIGNKHYGTFNGIIKNSFFESIVLVNIIYFAFNLLITDEQKKNILLGQIYKITYNPPIGAYIVSRPRAQNVAQR